MVLFFFLSDLCSGSQRSGYLSTNSFLPLPHLHLLQVLPCGIHHRVGVRQLLSQPLSAQRLRRRLPRRRVGLALRLAQRGLSLPEPLWRPRDGVWGKGFGKGGTWGLLREGLMLKWGEVTLCPRETHHQHYSRWARYRTLNPDKPPAAHHGTGIRSCQTAPGSGPGPATHHTPERSWPPC
jgi:hypothetical protein